MDIGLMMDSDYRADQTQQEAFDAVLTTADQAETLGFDSIWLAERHFSPPGKRCPGLIHWLRPPPAGNCHRHAHEPTAHRHGSPLVSPWGTPCVWRKRSLHSML